MKSPYVHLSLEWKGLRAMKRIMLFLAVLSLLLQSERNPRIRLDVGMLQLFHKFNRKIVNYMPRFQNLTVNGEGD